MQFPMIDRHVLVLWLFLIIDEDPGESWSEGCPDFVENRTGFQSLPFREFSPSWHPFLFKEQLDCGVFLTTLPRPRRPGTLQFTTDCLWSTHASTTTKYSFVRSHYVY